MHGRCACVAGGAGCCACSGACPCGVRMHWFWPAGQLHPTLSLPGCFGTVMAMPTLPSTPTCTFLPSAIATHSLRFCVQYKEIAEVSSWDDALALAKQQRVSTQKQSMGAGPTCFLWLPGGGREPTTAPALMAICCPWRQCAFLSLPCRRCAAGSGAAAIQAAAERSARRAAAAGAAAARRGGREVTALHPCVHSVMF